MLSEVGSWYGKTYGLITAQNVGFFKSFAALSHRDRAVKYILIVFLSNYKAHSHFGYAHSDIPYSILYNTQIYQIKNSNIFYCFKVLCCKTERLINNWQHITIYKTCR